MNDKNDKTINVNLIEGNNIHPVIEHMQQSGDEIRAKVLGGLDKIMQNGVEKDYSKVQANISDAYKKTKENIDKLKEKFNDK